MFGNKPPPSTDAVAQAIVQAWTSGRPARAADYAGAIASADDAYTVQQRVEAALHGNLDPARPRAWKSGGSERDPNRLSHTVLPSAGLYNSIADLRDLPFVGRRGVEAEVAFRLTRDVDEALARSLEQADAMKLFGEYGVTIEVIDSRWDEGLRADPLLRLADLQSHRALVLGNWIPWLAVDWLAMECTVRVGRSEPVTVRGSHPLRDPTYVLPHWLRHATRSGRVVPAGSYVTTGSWVGTLDADAGDSVEVEFDAIGKAGCLL